MARLFRPAKKDIGFHRVTLYIRGELKEISAYVKHQIL